MKKPRAGITAVEREDGRPVNEGTRLERYENPDDPLNAASYHTGRPCIERGCERPAGTHWSRFWCQPCNAARMKRISGVLEHEMARLEGKVPVDSMPPNTEAQGRRVRF